MDINTGRLMKNAFRVTRERGVTASRIRVPGGHMDAALLDSVRDIAQRYGNGTVHITSRQGFEIPGIRFEDMPAVNALLQPLIEGLGINQGERGEGYSAAGTRNITACIGNRVCPYACYDTTAFAARIEQAVFPNDLHFKIALTGCPNDCTKVRQHDFGIIGMNEPSFEAERCVNCGACVKKCKNTSVEALKMVNFRPQRDAQKCIGCGECVLNCPVCAWTRNPQKYYRLTLFGRTGRKNPRLGEDFIKWVDEESIIRIILNTYDYVKRYIRPDARGGKEHIGYIIDRTGFEEYKKWALRDVNLPALAEVSSPLYWKGIRY